MADFGWRKKWRTEEWLELDGRYVGNISLVNGRYVPIAAIPYQMSLGEFDTLEQAKAALEAHLWQLENKVG